MATTIKLKNSVTTTAAPSSLVQGEVAVNVTDKKVWVGNAASGIVQILGAGATVAGTTATLTGDASISGLTVGKGYGSLSQNTVFGVSALSSASLTGNYNTAIGYQAGYSNTTGTRITALGVEAIKTNTTGNYNTSIGYQSLTLNSTGSFNTACGDSSLLNTTGSNNTALGMGAGQLITSGTKNTIVGMYNGNQNGLDIRTASNYIVLSDGDGNPRFLFNGAAGYLNTLTQRNSGQLSIDYNGSTNGGMGINDTASANGSTFIGFLTGGTFRGSINNVANTAVAYNTTSDYRLKENIAPNDRCVSHSFPIKTMHLCMERNWLC